MFTFIHHANSYGTQLTVTLDLEPKDIAADSTATQQLIKQAKTSKRKLGAIEHAHMGTTYFSYDPAQQTQYEVHLLAALSTPHSDVHINAANGVNESWSNY